MLTPDTIRAAISQALEEVNIPGLGERYQGKVRDFYRLADGRRGTAKGGTTRRVMVTTDRLSAFDRVLGLIPYKGQVLNQLSVFWFQATYDIVPNHLLDVLDPNVAIVQECELFPVEVIVRGYITGVTTTSLWYHYARGEREIYGIEFPDGLHKNGRLPEPVITPTTKARDGGHDQRLTVDEVVGRGLVAPHHWTQICEAALAIFQRGQAMAEEAGLILVDTKYEFGMSPNGEVMLVDEVHTPDSSRFWQAGTYQERMAAGREPDNFDKEFIRLWYAGQGYRGDGEPPAMPEELIVAASQRYQKLYEMLTREVFDPAEYPAQERIRASVLSAA